MIRFKRRYFPERKYRLPLRWVVWGVIIMLFLIFVVFLKMFR